MCPVAFWPAFSRAGFKAIHFMFTNAIMPYCHKELVIKLSSLWHCLPLSSNNSFGFAI